MRDVTEKIGDALVMTVRQYVGPLKERLDFLEKEISQLPPGPAGARGTDGEQGPPGPPGESVSLEVVKSLVTEAVAEVSLPEPIPGPVGPAGAPGEPGQSVSIESVAEMVRAEVAKAIAAIPPARDGRDGMPGVPGAPGRDGVDGEKGIDGVDGLGLEDLDISMDEDGRTLSVKFVRGDVVREKKVKLATVLDRGVFKAEQSYEKGDGCTWGGSYWIAQKDAVSGKPGESDDWRLAVKKGRDGRDGERGKDYESLRAVK